MIPSLGFNNNCVKAADFNQILKLTYFTNSKCLCKMHRGKLQKVNTAQFKDLSFPTPSAWSISSSFPQTQKEDADITHNVKVSLYLGAQLLFFDLVAYFLFLSLR